MEKNNQQPADAGNSTLPLAQILDLARRCGIKATEAALIEFAALVRDARPLPQEEMRPVQAAQPVEAGSAVQAEPFMWVNPGQVQRARLTDYAESVEAAGTSVKFGHFTMPLYAHPAEPVGGITANEARAALLAMPIEEVSKMVVGGALVAKAEQDRAMVDLMPKRAAFLTWAKARALDVTEDKDAWGKRKFAHSHVQALWDGWFNAPAAYASESAAAPADDFARGVIAALGVLNAHGYPHGSVYHDEIVQSVGEASIYAAAEENDYRWAGLDPAKKPSATQQPTTQGEKS